MARKPPAAADTTATIDDNAPIGNEAEITKLDPNTTEDQSTGADPKVNPDPDAAAGDGDDSETEETEDSELSAEEKNTFELNNGLTDQVLQPDGTFKTIAEVRAEHEVAEKKLKETINEKAAPSIDLLKAARQKALDEDALKVS